MLKDFFNSLLGTRSLNNPSVSLADPAAYELFGGTPSKSGQIVNEDTALRHSAVYACVRIIGQSIASLPLEVFEAKENGDSVPATSHPVYQLVNQDPSEVCSSYDFRNAMQKHLTLAGNAYARIYRDQFGRPVELEILPASKVSTYKKNRKTYYYLNDTQEVLLRTDIIHLLNMSDDGITGKSAVQVARETIGSNLAAVEYGSSVYENGAHIKGVLLHPAKLAPDAYARLRETWRSQYSGARNAGSIPVLEQGMKFEAISLSPADSKFLESMKAGVEDIARIFGVPLHLIGALDRATFNNVEQMSLEYVVHTLRPICKNWEQELNRKLFLPSERGRYFVRFNLDGLLRGDTKSRGEYYRNMFNIGALSPNDIRRLENLNSRPDGDEYFTPLNMTTDPNQVQNENQPNA